jgi:hypothetical protein
MNCTSKVQFANCKLLLLEITLWINIMMHSSYLDFGKIASRGASNLVVRPNPPPLSVRSPSSGFGLTCLRWDGFLCG